MANTTPALTSFATAVVILPPPEIQRRINAFRDGNDKSFPRWTSHLTMLFPFVEATDLPAACSLLRETFARTKLSPFRFTLDKIGKFKQREYDTVYLGTSDKTNLYRVWNVVSSAFNYSGRDFVPHLTLGQAYRNDNSGAFLADKGKLLLEKPIEWDVHSIIVLQKSEVDGGEMKLYEEILLGLDSPVISPITVTALKPQTYRFSSSQWSPFIPAKLSTEPRSLNIATYNVLHDLQRSPSLRLPRLVDALLAISPLPDIICLQEVSDGMLRGFLSDPRIQSHWPICTHEPTSVLPNEWNIVCFARDGFDFTWETVQLRKHKPASILHLVQQNGESLAIAAIHLKAGLRAIHYSTKLQELETLLTYLRRRFPSSPWIVAGDFNLGAGQTVPTNALDTFDDAWLSVHGSEEGGITYDPGANSLAAQTVLGERTPQRYDRIWVRRIDGISVQSVQLFGQGEFEASDHYGLAASISLSGPDGSANPEIRQMSTVQGSAVAVTSRLELADGQLESFLLRQGGFPSTQAATERAEVVPILKELLTLSNTPAPAEGTEDILEQAPRRTSVVKFEVVPVGSFGFDIDTESSDVDVLVVGNIPPTTFWSLVRSLLRRKGSEAKLPIVLKRFVKEATVPMMELNIGSVSVDLQYCPAASVVERWNEVATLPRTDPLFLLPASTLRTLNAYRSIHALERVLSPEIMPAFRLAYRALKVHCVSEGIYSSKFGYLSGIHLTMLLARITVLSPPDSTAEQLLRAFFATYADWDWGNRAVTVPGLNDEVEYTRAVGREPVVILTVEKPTFNLVQFANQHTLAAIKSSFERTQDMLRAGHPWVAVTGHGGLYGSGFKRVLKQYESVIKIDLSFWCASSVKARAWVSYVQSRLQHLLVSLQSIPSATARLWPARLADANNPGDATNGLESFYFIGFNAPDKASLDNRLQAALFTFEDQLRRDERFYDATEMFVSVTLVEPSQLPTEIIAPPEWRDGGIDPLEDDSDDSGQETQEALEDRDSDSAFAPISAKQLKKKKQQKEKGTSSPSVAVPKLRTSADVYHRILWDRELNTDDYLIGYEDRFNGLMELPLTSWKRDVDHEEFIPFHRVMHFRRKTDGVLVWDRRKKIDLIFGSGVQAN